MWLEVNFKTLKDTSYTLPTVMLEKKTWFTRADELTANDLVKHFEPPVENMSVSCIVKQRSVGVVVGSLLMYIIQYLTHNINRNSVNTRRVFTECALIWQVEKQKSTRVNYNDHVTRGIRVFDHFTRVLSWDLVMEIYTKWSSF